MQFSRQFLNRYVEINDLSNEALSELLTGLGLEVETYKEEKPLHPKIVIGEITGMRAHPKADKLNLCEVSIGNGQSISVVCGGKNARAGLKVALALEGAELPGGMLIKAGEIRGEASKGMLCSEKELGISDLDSGIMEVAGDYALGVSLCDTDLGKGDAIYELGITPNRGDCLSYLGIARDVGAKLRREAKKPSAQLDEVATLTQDSSEFMQVEIAPDVACARFVGLYIGGLEKASSPFWLRRFLQVSGMRSISLVVDVANFVMLELGMPVHTYDRAKVEGHVLRADFATLGLAIKTLDGQTQKLKGGELVIADAKKALGIAGVMGGESSEISDQSQELLLEVAHFDPVSVRRCAKRLSLHSEASARFERGIDISALPMVAVRFAEVLQGCYKELGLPELKIAKTLVDLYPKPVAAARVAVRLDRVKRLLGLPLISLNSCVEDLTALGLTLLDKTEERALFEIPQHRNDLTREVDLIEEIARMEGFEKVPYQLPKMDIHPNVQDPFVPFTFQVKAFFAAASVCEMITYPFFGNDIFQKLRIEAGHPFFPSLKLKNPINEAEPHLAATLIPNLVTALERNHRDGHRGLGLFQMSRVYRHAEAKPGKEWGPYFARLHTQGRHLKGAALQEARRPIERMLLSAVFDSPYLSKEWNRAALSVDFFVIKAMLQRFCKNFRLGTLECEKVSGEPLPFLNPGTASWLKLGSEVVGYMGYLHPRTQKALKLHEDNIVLFELDLEACFGACQTTKLNIEAPAQRFPEVQRDFAFVVDESLSYGQLNAWIQEFSGKKHLKGVHPFDIYVGSPLPTGKKSLGLSLNFGSSEKTLSDQEVESECQGLLAYLQKSHGIGLRA